MSYHQVTNDEERGSGRQLSGGVIATGSGVGLLGVFMAQNTDDVAVDFLFWDFTWPVWLLTLGSALTGGLVWFGAGVLRRRRRRRERRAERRD